MILKLFRRLRLFFRKRQADVLFLCDGKACERCDPSVCNHTTDLNHAVNFRFEYERCWVEQ